MLKMFREFKEATKASMEVHKRLVWFPLMVDVDGYVVAYCPTTVLGLGGRVAAAIRLTNGQNLIVIDDHFYKLSESARKFIILHEEGHLVSQHNQKVLKRYITSLMGKIAPEEIEADDYAASIVGKDIAISALKELHNIVPSIEIRRRIKRFQIA